MRNALASEITKLAASDPRIVFLSGDIGNKLFDDFKSKFPDRFFNCGVAEANMMSVAAGMAISGLRPVVYTIAPFITYRCFEQIRIDVCYHNAPVVIVGVGGGLSYASLGPTHHSCEEIGCLRTLPNLTVAAPGDAHEVRALLRSALNAEHPTYLRIGKKGEPVVHRDTPHLKLGEACVLTSGSDVALLSCGTMLEPVCHLAEALKEKGISAEVVSFPTVKPLDHSYLERAAERFKVLVSIEEHSVIGGLGSAIGEWMLAGGRTANTRLLSLGTPDRFFKVAGEQEYAREQLGLSVESMLEQIVEALS